MVLVTTAVSHEDTSRCNLGDIGFFAVGPLAECYRCFGTPRIKDDLRYTACWIAGVAAKDRFD
jgi:hypothetical protein